MAVIYLNENNIGDARNIGDTIWGGKGREKAYIHDSARNVTVSPAVEELHFTGNIGDYTFYAGRETGQLVIANADGAVVATFISVGGNAICFKDGGVTLTQNPTDGSTALIGAAGSAPMTLNSIPTHFQGAVNTSAGFRSDIGGGDGPSPQIREFTLQQAMDAYDAGELPTLYLLSDGRVDLGSDTVKHIKDGLSKAKNIIDRCANEIADRPALDPGYVVTDTAANVKAEYAPGGTVSANSLITGNNGPHKVYIRDSVYNVEHGSDDLKAFVPPLNPDGYFLEDKLAELVKASAKETYKNAESIIVRDEPARFTDPENPITAGEERVLTDAAQVVVRGTLQAAVENIDGLRAVMREFGKLDAFHYEITSLGPIRMANDCTVADVKAELANANRILLDPQTTYVGTNTQSTLTYKDIQFGLQDSMDNLLGNPDVLAEATLGRVCVDSVANLAAHENAIFDNTSTSPATPPVILGYVISDTAENIVRGRTEHRDLFTNGRCDDVVPSNAFSETIPFASGPITPSGMTDHADITIDASAAADDVTMDLSNVQNMNFYDSGSNRLGFRHVSLTGVGGDGDDILVGRSGGTDGTIVLVGGKGADLLQAGGDRNILYAGAEATNGVDDVKAGAINAGTMARLRAGASSTSFDQDAKVEAAIKGHNVLTGGSYDGVTFHASNANDTFLFQDGSANGREATINGFRVKQDTILLFDNSSSNTRTSADSATWAADAKTAKFDSITIDKVKANESTHDLDLIIDWSSLSSGGSWGAGSTPSQTTIIHLAGVQGYDGNASNVQQFFDVIAN